MLLNEQQKNAITTEAPYALIKAGPGTGKTTVIIHRALHIINKFSHLKGFNILILTFSNKAANELKQRLKYLDCEKECKAEVSNIWVGTFHAIAFKILKKYKKNINIVSENDSLEYIKEVFAEIKAKFNISTNHAAQNLLNIIQKFKNSFTTPSNDKDGWIADLYTMYQKRLSEQNQCDFGDILIELRNLFIEAPNIARYYQSQFKYLLIDEYQDINFAQDSIIRIFLQLNASLYCVADEDQLIYEWRGADINNILDFTKKFPNAKEIFLLENYRCSKNITAAALSLIQNNKKRTPNPHCNNKIINAANATAHPIEIHVFNNNYDECYLITAMIEKLQLSTTYNKDIAILVRQNIHIGVICGALESFDIEYFVNNEEQVATISDTNRHKSSNIGMNNQQQNNNQQQKKIFISTIHSAKGMEFDAVFLPFWEMGIMPAKITLSSMEEERRIAYVAITRARENIVISYSKTRNNKETTPSVFINEIAQNSHLCKYIEH